MVEGHTYFFAEIGSYAEAKIICHDLYMDLVAIDTHGENTHLKEKVVGKFIFRSMYTVRRRAMDFFTPPHASRCFLWFL